MSDRFDAERIIREAASGAFPDEGNVLVRNQDGWVFEDVNDLVDFEQEGDGDTALAKLVGGKVRQVITGTNLSEAATQITNINYPGAKTEDFVIFSIPAGQNQTVIMTAVVTAADNIRFIIQNPNDGDRSTITGGYNFAVLRFDGVGGGRGGTTIEFLDEIGDVDAPTPNVGDVIEWDGGSWITVSNDKHLALTLAGVPNYLTLDFVNQILTMLNVNLASEVQGNLPVTNLDSGAGATAASFWRGDGSWAPPPTTPTASEYVSQGFSAVTSVQVIHNFGQWPIVQILNSADDILIPLSVVHNTINDFTVTFALAETGTVLATLGSPGLPFYRQTAIDTTITLDDHFIETTVTGVRVELPTVVGNQGRIFEVKNVAIGPCHIDTVLGQLIDNFDESIQIIQWESARLFCTGIGWIIT